MSDQVKTLIAENAIMRAAINDVKIHGGDPIYAQEWLDFIGTYFSKDRDLEVRWYLDQVQIGPPEHITENRIPGSFICRDPHDIPGLSPATRLELRVTPLT